LNEWFVTEQGARVEEAFLEELTPLKNKLYGDILLQLGSCGDNAILRTLRYHHKCLITPYLNASTTLVSSLTELPIEKESVDCVIAPLTMNAFHYEKSPLDEIDRVLKPMGHVVFFGVNPISLWGVWLRLAHSTCFGVEHGVLHSLFSMKRAMAHRGYVQCHLSGFYYIPPAKRPSVINKLEIFNVIGKMISPMPSGFYCFVVQKLQVSGIPLTPVRIEDDYSISSLQAVGTGLQTRKYE
jgi:hypothetical protein